MSDDVEALADLLHPWLDGTERCPYSPVTLCMNHGRSRHLARLLAERDARIKAEAWDEGVRHAETCPGGMTCDPRTANPYRADRIEATP